MQVPTRYGRPDPEKLDPTPIEVPFSARRPRPLQDVIARMVRDAIAVEKGEEFETFEEANDFEEDDPDTLDLSPYELKELREDPTDLQLETEALTPANPPDKPSEPAGAPKTGDPSDPDKEEPS